MLRWFRAHPDGMIEVLGTADAANFSYTATDRESREKTPDTAAGNGHRSSGYVTPDPPAASVNTEIPTSHAPQGSGTRGRPQTYSLTADMLRHQEYVQDVQTLRWHEAPMPRLFIVLPSVFVDELSPMHNTFRLFWMCEYTENDFTAPHMDLHPGFDLQQPAKFLEQYKDQLFWNFQLFRRSRDNILRYYESLSESRNDDPHGSYDQAIAFLQTTLDMTEAQVEMSLDMMTDYLRKNGADPDTTHALEESASPFTSLVWGVRRIPRLSAHDLVQLRSFLLHPGVNKSGIGEASNLYRTADEDGYVHWVCLSHFHHIYPFSVFSQTYMRNTNAHCGTYDMQKGQIVARPSSGMEARKLYGIMQTSPGFVSELCLHIGWDATLEDLSYLCNAAVDFNISSLKLTGPGIYLVSTMQSERLLEILTHDRIQSFSLENAQGFLKNISPLFITCRFFGLRVLQLSLDTESCASIQELDVIRRRLLWTIACSPNLKELDIVWYDMARVCNTWDFLVEMAKHPFQSLAIKMRLLEQEISTTIDKRNFTSVDLSISDLFRVANHPLISKGVVRTLSVMKAIDISESNFVDLLQSALPAKSCLESITLTAQAPEFKAIEQAVKNAVNDSPEGQRLKRLILIEAAVNSITATYSFEPQHYIVSNNGTDCSVDSSFVDVTIIDGDSGFESVLIDYGAYIRILNMAHPFALHHLAIFSNAIARQENSRLESLLIALDCGRWRGDQNLRQIFESCSKTLKQLTLIGYIENTDCKSLFLKTLAYYKGPCLVVLKSVLSNKRARSRLNGVSSGQERANTGSTNGQCGEAEVVATQWIEQVRGAISKDTTLTIAEDLEALSDITPGLMRSDLERLKQNR
ncbi:hypothetical protein BGZ58_000115 [Dissophora ornata]|nr:hypothetical protein BGZ58_000115 [Dissophora ornata]